MDVVGARLVLAGGAAESVNRRTDPHIHESRLFEHLPPACARQASGYSAGPQVDLPQRSGRDRLAVGYVRELQPAARRQHAHYLREYSPPRFAVLAATQLKRMILI